MRALDASPQTSELFVSAGYDHSVKLWDSRQQKAVMTMVAGTDSRLVGQPVESVLFAQNGTMLISAAGSLVQIWDVLAGGR